MFISLSGYYPGERNKSTPAASVRPAPDTMREGKKKTHLRAAPTQKKTSFFVGGRKIITQQKELFFLRTKKKRLFSKTSLV